MKRIFKILSLIFIIIIISGCNNKINKLSYVNYNEYFSSKNDYTIIDNTSKYGLNIRRYFEAGNGKIQIFYIEFDSKKNTQKYINEVYLKDKNNKVKNNKNYTYIKNTKNKYMKLYKVDNVIVIATTSNKKYKRDVNKILKDLGY